MVLPPKSLRAAPGKWSSSLRKPTAAHQMPKLKRFTEGIPTPRMVDEIAGGSLSVVSSLATSPRYVANKTLGPILFHHLLYGMGSLGPHRPIVVRKACSQANLGQQEQSILTNLRHNALAHGVDTAAVGRWYDLSGSCSGDDGASCSISSATLPPLGFAVGTMSSFHWLRLPDAMKKLHEKERGGMSAAVVAEPWRVGVALDPLYTHTVVDAVVDGAAAVWHSHPSESYLIPCRSMSLCVAVPQWATTMCSQRNAARAAKQAKEGYFAPSVYVDDEQSAQDGGDVPMGPAEQHVRANRGDVCYVPRGWRYSMEHMPNPVTQNVLTGRYIADESTSSPSEKEYGTSAGTNTVSVFRVGYRPYPLLSEHQAAHYVAADYTIGSLEEFYRCGGNNPFKQYY